MAVKLDISVLLEAIGAEMLAYNGVVTIEQCAALTEERLEELGISSYSNVHDAIRKAKELLSSRDDVLQQELLVSGTSWKGSDIKIRFAGCGWSQVDCVSVLLHSSMTTVWFFFTHDSICYSPLYLIVLDFEFDLYAKW